MSCILATLTAFAFIAGPVSARNLFQEWLGKSEAETEAKIQSAWKHYFEGDTDTERLYFPVNKDAAYIAAIGEGDVRTEGMSYGMMIAVQLDRREEFDRLWKWARTHMYHKDGPRRGYFAWHCRFDGTPISGVPASDGEEWFVTALFFAAHRWGDGEGIFAYSREAQMLLREMLHKPRNGDDTAIFNRKRKQVVFCPIGRAATITNPSYHLPHFYELWARWAKDPADRAFWAEAARESRQFFRRAAHPKTGLMPERANFDGTPVAGKDKFAFDAWRTLSNVALDHAWGSGDDWEVEQSNRVLRFFASEGSNLVSQYTLDGQRIGDNHSPGFFAMAAVAGLGADPDLARPFVQRLWEMPLPEGQWRYYNGLLTFLALLEVSGRFQIWEALSAFPLVQNKQAAPICVDKADHAGVLRAAGDLQADIERVTGIKPQLSTGKVEVIVGTLGKSAWIDKLVKAGKIDASVIAGKWESFLIATVEKPLPGVDQALVIAGSDKRGTIYGIYEISEQIGVSPWYWWADVPVKHRDNLSIAAGTRIEGPPAVKYRGIFLNDEAPALAGWTHEKFGGFNQKLYTKVFELLLRLRGNYLWPAMWGNAFNEDDPDNPRLADEYGIVMGTSHHEPMLRAQQEWKRHGSGAWNYATNEAVLKGFWEKGIERNKNFESIITVGMRGDGDEPMVEGGDMSANTKLLEKIVQDQRAIIAQHVGDPAKVPQIWALYKEVMDYYDHGMRVPGDVTLLWCDDNWGNIRRLPTPDERKRSGGAGIYYHFDYVGGPRNYKWINTNPLPKIWEQMNLAYHYGADRIWIVNVGDLKPMEVPMEFFLRMAWNPEAIQKEQIAGWTRRWAEREFGPEHAAEIADLVSKYAKYNGWRKPELLAPGSFSLIHYREAERVSEAWNDIAARAEKLYRVIPAEQRDAFYQLVLYPCKAGATVVDLYIAAARNRLFAKQGRASANAEANRVRELFKQDQALSDQYNHELAGGKWNHMMDQTRIGYTSWQQPDKNIMPEVTELAVPDTADFGVAVEGSEEAWPGGANETALPPFDSLHRQRSYIDVFARGSRPIEFKATANQPWIVVSREGNRLWVDIDWNKAPDGESHGAITIEPVTVKLTAIKATDEQAREAQGCFGGLTGPIAFFAENASRNVPAGNVRWERIPDYGRGPSAMSIFPVTAESVLPPTPGPRLEYPVYIATAGKINVDAILGPTLNFVPGRGLRLAVSFDDEPARVLDAFAGKDDWNKAVADNARVLRSTHTIDKPGKHTLKITMVDPAVVLQKVILYENKPPPSYFGPPANDF